MRKCIAFFVLTAVVFLQSCTKQDLNDDELTTSDVYEVDRTKIERPGGN